MRGREGEEGVRERCEGVERTESKKIMTMQCVNTHTLTDFLHHGFFKEIYPLPLHVAGKHPVGVYLRVCHHKEPSQNVIHTLGIPDIWRIVGNSGGAG